MIPNILKVFLLEHSDKCVDIVNTGIQRVTDSFLMHVKVFFNSILHCLEILIHLPSLFSSKTMGNKEFSLMEKQLIGFSSSNRSLLSLEWKTDSWIFLVFNSNHLEEWLKQFLKSLFVTSVNHSTIKTKKS